MGFTDKWLDNKKWLDFDILFVHSKRTFWITILFTLFANSGTSPLDHPSVENLISGT